MTKILKYSFLLFIALLITNCSFDHKTGLWSGQDNEKKRIEELERRQNSKIEVLKIYTRKNLFSKEIDANNAVKLSKPINKISWEVAGSNLQNLSGNIYLPNINKNFLKKKVGKKKYLLSKIKFSPLTHKGSLFITDDTGSIYKISKQGKVDWRSNIYKKIYKKIYKNLSIVIHDNKIYVSDNIGFVYAINIQTGKLEWIKNHGVPLKSKIKIYKEKIYLINQDNRLVCLNIKDGSLIWDHRSISSFIKTQDFLGLAISKNGDLVTLDCSGSLSKLKADNGKFYWSLNIESSNLIQSDGFFTSSDIVVENNEVFFSTPYSFFAYNMENGYLKWEKNIASKNTPIIDNENVFVVSDNGFFLNLDRNTGKIIFSKNILKVLKKKKQKTNIVGFIMGSGKIYAVSKNGYLIVASATSGKVENFKKVSDSILSSPIISEGSLYILTENSKILGFGDQ